MIKYCVLCERKVEPKRKFGVGTLIMVILTMGWGILFLPFYQKRCPICGGTSFSYPPQKDQGYMPVQRDTTHTDMNVYQ